MVSGALESDLPSSEISGTVGIGLTAVPLVSSAVGTGLVVAPSTSCEMGPGLGSALHPEGIWSTSAVLAPGWGLPGGLLPLSLPSLLSRGVLWQVLAPLLQHVGVPRLWTVSSATGAPEDLSLPAVLGIAEEGSQLSLLPEASWSPSPAGLCGPPAEALLPLPSSGTEVAFLFLFPVVTAQGSGSRWSASLGAVPQGWGSSRASCPSAVPGCSPASSLQTVLGCSGVHPSKREQRATPQAPAPGWL